MPLSARTPSCDNPNNISSKLHNVFYHLDIPSRLGRNILTSLLFLITPMLFPSKRKVKFYTQKKQKKNYSFANFNPYTWNKGMLFDSCYLIRNVKGNFVSNVDLFSEVWSKGKEAAEAYFNVLTGNFRHRTYSETDVPSGPQTQCLTIKSHILPVNVQWVKLKERTICNTEA